MDTDVLVVGNGPVGQTTALLLARWGLEVTVVDARPHRVAAGSKAICQQEAALDVWASCGVDAIASEGLTWSRARTYFQDSELFTIELPAAGSPGLPPFVNLSQARTEAHLDAAIARQPRIRVLWGHEVTAVAQTETSVQVACRTPAGERSLAAAYAIACGGARGSELRAELGVRFEGRSFGDAFLICDIRASLPDWARERHFYFDPPWNPGRQVLIHPCPDSVFRIDWQVEPDFDLEAARSDGSLDRRIRQIVGPVPYEVVWSSIYRFHSRLVDRMRVGRVLLAGDLAHLVAPFGARGLNSGVADAENAAWKLAFVKHGWAEAALLESYHGERHAAAQENLAVTGATMDFLAPHTPALVGRRRLLLETARRRPGFHQGIDSGRLSEPFWYVGSPLTTPADDLVWPGRPEAGDPPALVPGVLVPDGPARDPHHPSVRRLRELCRSGILVLAPDTAAAMRCRRALAARMPTSAPLRVVGLDEIDPIGELTHLFADREGLWVIRPDAHIAAVVSSIPDLRAAIARLVGR